MSQALTTWLRETALELGFDLVGVTSAAPLAGTTRFTSWLAAGFHGTMSYLERTAPERGSLDAFLPGAASVICVAMTCGGRSEDCELPADHVRVASFAARRDYHDAIRRRLVVLGRRLATRIGGLRWRPAVDAQPVLEKELAQCAGLGFLGKHTLLVNPELGSHLLLGELVTTADLEPDTPVESPCGECTACLDACPTGALVAPGVLDARRCIAYLTIEHNGPSGSDSSASTHSFLFGCDLCQEACPYTAGGRGYCNPVLATRPELLRLSAAAVSGLDDAGWRALGAGTPLRRLNHSLLGHNLQAAVADREGSPGGSSHLAVPKRP